MVGSRAAPDPRRLAPVAVAALLALVYLIWQPPSLDLAAAEYRAWLFGHAGLAVWDNQWYGGHHLPGYSVLFPPLAHWLGPRVVGALAVVAAAALFERIAHERFGERAWVGATWFGAGVATTLFSGRLTFALGLVPALAALWALGAWTDAADRAGGGEDARATAGRRTRTHPEPTGPARRHGWGSGLLALVLALLPVAALAVAFPEGGIEPFAFSSFWPVLAFGAVALVLIPREERTLRIGVALYALGCTAAFLLDTPVGGNVVRLGALTAGPLLALVLLPRRRTALLLLAPFLLWWQWTAAVSDVRTASGDASVHAAYYAPLLAELARLGAGDAAAGTATGARLEIPFTRLHWEARHVAPHVALARGWERQLDLEVNPLFYGDQTGAPPLTAARYRAWLDRMAVRWVAVPDSRLDYSAQDEARLIAHGLPYLRPIWRDAHWRLYEVADAQPLADAPARVTGAGTDTLTLPVPRAGSYALRVRWTPYWAVTEGDGCVVRDGDWTRLRVRRAGTMRVTTRFSLARIGADSARCSRTGAVNGR